MSDRIPLPELSEEQVALADQGIVQFGAFMRDVLRQPENLNEIPSGATLAFYTLTLPDDWQPVCLTAFRPRRTKRWGVRVTGIGNPEDAPMSPRAMPDWLVSIAPLMQSASWESSDEAFAAIKEALQRATELLLLAGKARYCSLRAECAQNGHFGPLRRTNLSRSCGIDGTRDTACRYCQSSLGRISGYLRQFSMLLSTALDLLRSSVRAKEMPNERRAEFANARGTDRECCQIFDRRRQRRSR